MNRVLPQKHKIRSDRNRSIALEYYRLREEKRLRSIDALIAIQELGIYRSVTGKILTVKTLRCIVKNKRYLKNDRQ